MTNRANDEEFTLHIKVRCVGGLGELSLSKDGKKSVRELMSTHDAHEMYVQLVGDVQNAVMERFHQWGK